MIIIIITNPPKSLSAMDGSFLDCFNSLGLTQWVHEPAYHCSGNILDLNLASESDRIRLIKVLSPLSGCDLPTIARACGPATDGDLVLCVAGLVLPSGWSVSCDAHAHPSAVS